VTSKASTAALNKLGLGWKEFHPRYPQVSVVAVVGAPGPRADESGHDITYQAEAGLIDRMQQPVTLFADMTGAIAISEAVLSARLSQYARGGEGERIEVALSEAAKWLALPQTWGLTSRQGPLGGKHAGYRVYKCKDGRVAVAALEPHFAGRLVKLVGVGGAQDSATLASLTTAKMRRAVASFMADKTRKELEALSAAHDIPLWVMCSAAEVGKATQH
jgi:crotonobetainyl-CoA:carnitine CoA-transferase CaiB-like acyl-CoA transferase